MLIIETLPLLRQQIRRLRMEGKRVALVSGTNAEADAINDAIQQRRVDDGELDAGVIAWGMGE